MDPNRHDVEKLGQLALRLLDLPGTVSARRSADADNAWELQIVGDDFGAVCLLFDADDRPFAVMTLLDCITNDLSETDKWWGVAFPRCPGHRHPADYAVEQDAVALTCPVSGERITRVEVAS